MMLKTDKGRTIIHRAAEHGQRQVKNPAIIFATHVGAFYMNQILAVMSESRLSQYF
jgi:hypothetical protein